MKNRILGILALLLFSFVYVGAEAQVNSCDWEKSKKKCKSGLKPYSYYAFKITKVTFGATKDKKEVEVPLFMDASYRFVFNTEGLPQPVKISIFDKPAGHPQRKLLNETNSGDQFTFEPPKGRSHNRIYISYAIPPSNDGTDKKGCILFYSGTKGHF